MERRRAMKTERFNDLVKEIREASLNTLTKKNANYASSEDRLHNFKVGAAITGGTPAQAALGYMAKHLASLQDKVSRNDFHDREDLKEKIQDSINYLVFIWCCANEEMEKYTTASAAPNISQSRDLFNSTYGNELLNYCGGKLEGA